LAEHAAIVWPHRDQQQLRVRDSCMLDLSAQSPPSFIEYDRIKNVRPHIYRREGAYAGMLHLDLNMDKLLSLGEDPRDHVNVWIPFTPYNRDPLVFMTESHGKRVPGVPYDHLSYFRYSPQDKFHSAFLKPGEFFVFCALLVPHASMYIVGQDQDSTTACDRLSAELRMQCISAETQ
jgi:hypothetical protein